ncbi:MAG: polysaccharide lyase family 8 super-sandwich domain-containing protein [Motilibacteraceae bacterium]
MKPLVRLLGLLTAACLLVTGLAVAAAPAGAASGDAFDALRTKWIDNLVGNGDYDVADPDIADRIRIITETAQADWDTMDRSAERNFVFSPYPGSTHNQNITETYGYLRSMAIAYRTEGSALYGDTRLRYDVVAALDWLHAHWYNASIPFAGQTPDNNWFAWELGVPLNLTDVLGLMYGDLTTDQVAENLAAIDHFLPDPTQLGLSVGWHLKSEGANRAWAATSIGRRGILGKDAGKVQLATSSLSPLFQYAAPGGNGFYRDGSFVFHDGLPYTAGYGWSTIGDPTAAVVLYEGSPWAISDPNKYNLITWLKESYEPFVFRDRIPDSLAGREISRPGPQDRADGLISYALDMRQFATAEDKVHLERLVKYLVQTDPSLTYFSTASLPHIAQAKAIVADPDIAPLDPPTLYQQFPGMDRNIQKRPDYAFGVSMFSSRTQNYESINNENVNGWHTADGRTTLYTSDVDQYGGGYWAIVDYNRIPGTTVLAEKPDDALAPSIGRVHLAGPTPLTDELDDFSKVFYRTTRWTTDTSTPATFGGDASRVHRTADSHEQLIYRLDGGITSFDVDADVTGLSGLDRLQIWSSRDNVSYYPVKYAASSQPLHDGWTVETITPQSALPSGTKYLRIDLMPGIPQSRGDRDWVGGAALDGTYGAAGMQLHTPGQSLTANKSWFMFDNQIVALGSDITAKDGREAHTTVENRRLSDGFPGELTVDGTTVLPGDGTAELTGVRWAALSGGQAGSDIGYYFPDGSDLTATRETRSGDWADVGNGPAGQETDSFVGLDVDHGVDPTGGRYAYVLLPDRNPGQTRAYAEHPAVQVLAQDSAVHAVKETSKDIVAANFWTDAPTSVQVDGKDYLTSDRKSSVMTREDAQGVTVSVSDPTQVNSRTVVDHASDFSHLYDRSAGWVIESGGGFKRTTLDQQYVTYKLDKGVARFETTVAYNWNTGLKNTVPIQDRVTFHASSDGSTWTTVPASVKDPVTPVYGWSLDNTATLVPAVPLPAGTRFLKVQVENNDTRASWSPEVKKVVLTSADSTDGFVDVTLARSAGGVVSADPRVQVVSLSPVTLRVDVEGLQGRSVQARLSYHRPPVASVSLTTDQGRTSISEPGGTLQLSAKVGPADAYQGVTWSVSDAHGAPTDCAWVTGTGVLVGLRDCHVVVTATAQDGSGVAGSVPVVVDVTAPEITLTRTPAELSWNDEDLSLTASVDDGDGSGVASTSVVEEGSPRPPADLPEDGLPLDRSLGAHTYVVTATDQVGHQTTASFSYTVYEYQDTSAGQVGDQPLEAGRTVPLKFDLQGAGGAVSTASAALSVDGRPVPEGSFRRTGNHYQLNWRTAGLAAGTHRLEVSVAVGGTALPPRTFTVTLR